MKNKLIKRALEWRSATHLGRTESEINIYLTALQDADIPQEIVDEVEKVLMPEITEEWISSFPINQNQGIPYFFFLAIPNNSVLFTTKWKQLQI